MNQGAPTTGAPFPGTNAALFANAGETMAQTLERISCETGSALASLPEPFTQPCSQILGTDVIYAPVWTKASPRRKRMRISTITTAPA